MPSFVPLPAGLMFAPPRGAPLPRLTPPPATALRAPLHCPVEHTHSPHTTLIPPLKHTHCQPHCLALPAKPGHKPSQSCWFAARSTLRGLRGAERRRARKPLSVQKRRGCSQADRRGMQVSAQIPVGRGGGCRTGSGARVSDRLSHVHMGYASALCLACTVFPFAGT